LWLEVGRVGPHVPVFDAVQDCGILSQTLDWKRGQVNVETISTMNSQTNQQTTGMKLVLQLALTLVLLVSTRAGASTNYTLSVTADRPDAIYQRGDPVTFTIKLQLDQQPLDGAEVSWMITKDGVPPTTSGKVKLAGGSATVTGRLNEPGFLLCRATFAGPNEPARFALGGAAIDPLQIKPSLSAPADFDEFWTAQKKKLAAVPVNPRLTPVESPVKGVDGFDLQADCVGAPVSGYFAKPTGAKPKRLPAIHIDVAAGHASTPKANEAIRSAILAHVATMKK
jgi:cephalosporin-C deacetylase